MATVSLQTVFDEARRAIEAGAADKAIGIAQHILVHFPRMIEGYRLLGEAHLNASQPEQAAAAFERVLEADPENVAAYYGLGLARQSLDQRGAAITAFERALEIQPNLADLRSQLMRLYADTPGSAGQFRLSRAGLGRLYARGGMFGQAIDEFRAVLDSEPSRDDVKAALAEALWRDGQEDEAMEFCRDVLDRQADLLKPTVLLGYLLFATGQPEGETLWRRAAEQDSTMTLARSLFDILPPIRLEEPVLPEFDEAEWRAKEARRSAEQPAQAAPPAFATTSEDDFFADSWLSSAGTAATAASSARTHDAELNALTAGSSTSSARASEDDDFLASLLGFSGSEPEPAPAPSALDREPAQPFGFDWEDEISAATPQLNEALPSSLDEVGLHDSEMPRRQDVSGVQPFSFDDWSLDNDLPSANTPAPSEAEADLDFPDIAGFSLDDDTSDQGGGVKPFSFEDEPTGGVEPFSLDAELGDFGGVAPFSFEEEASNPSTGNAPAPAESGLGNVQPFSLDDWGLDDTPGSNLKPLSSDELAASDDQLNEFDAFKPFSLDELSLDTLDEEIDSGLSGPQMSGEDQEDEEPAGFSWQEPSWRTQTAQTERPESSEGDSIFAKLLRNRPTDPSPSQPPAPIQPVDRGAADEEMNFFSIDDTPLRLDDGEDQVQWFSDLSATPGDQTPSSTEDVALPGLPGSEEVQATGLSSQAAEPTAEEDLTDVGSIFSLEDLESDQGFSWETSGTSQPVEPTAEESQPFALGDLGLSDDELAVLDIQSESSATPGTEQETDSLPFSLNDLGLSDDELAALSLEEGDVELAEPTADQAATLPTLPEDMRSDLGETMPPAAAAPRAEEAVDMTPFSLADLGLDEEELSFFEQAQAAQTDVAPPAAAAPSEEQGPDMTPFSLADLGLNDDELAFFEQAQAGQDLDTASQQTSEDVDTLFADFDIPSASEEQPGLQQPELSTDAPAPADDTIFGESLVAETDERAFSEAPAAPRAEEAVDMTPFSLADLGLDEEELSFFEQAQAAQTAAAAPEAESATAPEADAAAAPEAEQGPDMTPFSLADLGLNDDELAFFEQAQQETTQPESEAAEAAAPEIQDVTETPAPFESPFSVADLESGDVFAQADQAAASTEAASEPSSEAPNVFHSDTRPPDHALPMDLPEGAQPAASAAEEYHPTPAQPASEVATSAGSDLSAIHSMLMADPENDTMRLAVARMSQQTNDLGQALEHYKQLIKRGNLLDEVVVDLQDSIADSDDPQALRRLHRLLGDAYMKQNRFREAMDEYSWTLARSR